MGESSVKIKIRNKIYDSSEEPLMLILSDKDKRNIIKMNKEDTKYCVHPDFMKRFEVAEFINKMEDENVTL